jgi:translation elongation factor EF-G
MEPFMLLEIVVPNYSSSQIISDLTSVRRGKIISIKCENDLSNKNKSSKFVYDFLLDNKNMLIKNTGEDIIAKIYAVAPLSELVGYSAYIRSITKGEGKFFMKFHEFDKVSIILQAKILDGSYFYE